MNLNVSTTTSPVRATYMVCLWNKATQISVRPKRMNSILTGPIDGMAEFPDAIVINGANNITTVNNASLAKLFFLEVFIEFKIGSNAFAWDPIG